MMRLAVSRCVVAALAAALAGACGATDAAGDDDDGNVPDAGVGSCDMTVSITPPIPVAPVSIVVTGAIDRTDLAGLERYRWTVTRSGAPVKFTLRDPDAREIEFVAGEPGPYEVRLDGDLDGITCGQAERDINVRDPAAQDVAYRLKLIPPAGIAAPPQLQTVTIPSLADFELEDLTLAAGMPIAGSVVDATAAGVPGYVRLTPVGDPALSTPTEAFPGADGAYSTRVVGGDYDVLVVPVSAGIAPAEFRALPASGLNASLTMTSGDVVTGSVLDSDGAPIAGARVAMTVGGVPSTIATTAPNGSFSLLARVGGGAATAVSVTAPDGGASRLELAADAGFVAAVGEPVVIQLAAVASARTETFAIVDSDGATPVPGATATFIARPVAVSGTLTAGGSPFTATGHARVVATADGTGNTGPVSLPPAIYDVVVSPPAGASTTGATSLSVVDLTAGPAPTQLSLALPATLRGLFDVNARAMVTAVPRGPLAVAAAPTVQTVAETGTFELALVGGGNYEITVRPAPGLPIAGARVDATAPAPGAVVDVPAIALPAARVVTGVVESPDVAGGVSGVTLALLCGNCTGPAAVVPIAEAVSRADGSFEMRIPDPGAKD